MLQAHGWNPCRLGMPTSVINLQVITAVGLHQILPCSRMLAARGETALFPRRFAGCWRKAPGVQRRGAWTRESIRPRCTVHTVSRQGKAGICFGTLRRDEQQSTGENQDVLVGEGVVKAMTERCRNPRGSLVRWSSHPVGAAFPSPLRKMR